MTYEEFEKMIEDPNVSADELMEASYELLCGDMFDDDLYD